ncbi:hypothetical protein BGX28_001263, partial [Mortierella sp. GBA30]
MIDSQKFQEEIKTILALTNVFKPQQPQQNQQKSSDSRKDNKGTYQKNAQRDKSNSRRNSSR